MDERAVGTACKSISFRWKIGGKTESEFPEESSNPFKNNRNHIKTEVSGIKNRRCFEKGKSPEVTEFSTD